jgi:CRP/FNR family transcriptional regulator
MLLCPTDRRGGDVTVHVTAACAAGGGAAGGGELMRKPDCPAPQLAPPLRAVPFLKTGGQSIQLTPQQRESLAAIGLRIRLPPRMLIYREASAAHWVFAVVEGSVKTYRELPSGKRTVSAFLFKGDLFGLAEAGAYLNTAQAITGVTLYRLPLVDLTVLLKHDPDLQFQFLAKITHELRESQRRAILINRKDAAGRLAMFLLLMCAHSTGAVSPHGTVALPMSRSDIAGFLGLSLEAVSRAAGELERRGLVRFENRNLARIVDMRRLESLANRL